MKQRWNTALYATWFGFFGISMVSTIASALFFFVWGDDRLGKIYLMLAIALQVTMFVTLIINWIVFPIAAKIKGETK